MDEAKPMKSILIHHKCISSAMILKFIFEQQPKKEAKGHQLTKVRQHPTSFIRKWIPEHSCVTMHHRYQKGWFQNL